MPAHALTAAVLLGVLAGAGLAPVPSPSPAPSPVIDMHLHTTPWEAPATGAPPEDFDQSWERTRAALDRHGIVLGLASGSMEIAAHWHRRAPSRVTAGVLFPCRDGQVPNSRGRKCFASGAELPDLAWLREEIKAGRVGFLGEITSQYSGLSPADPRLEPYWALAEELEVPVGIHMGTGPPGAIYPAGVCGPVPCAPGYRAALTSPLLLEEVLVRHPRLRVWVMHAGWPMKEEMVALLWSHPSVYVDVAVLGFVQPPKAYAAYVCDLVDRGFGKRILWGSDFAQFDAAVAHLESVPCLTPEQKRDIFYNNAATFLRLDEGAAARSR